MRTVARRFFVAFALYVALVGLTPAAEAQLCPSPPVGGVSQQQLPSHEWNIPSISTRSWGFFVSGMNSWAIAGITAPKPRHSAYLLREGRGRMK